MLKKGDKVSFLNEVGGGVVTGFQGNGIVLVEDEDGFEIPMRENEVCLIASQSYEKPNPYAPKPKAAKVAENNEEEEVEIEPADLSLSAQNQKSARVATSSTPTLPLFR